ncbi:DUF192 domain-containing protein [Idiomarina seosinensis]|uniref:DUF192 domain-containing protein n=1 Tax=Idiomarina seosinensis TaxID=281739 RepID=UPI00384E0066
MKQKQMSMPGRWLTVLALTSALGISTSVLAQQWRVPAAQEFARTKICLGEMQQPLQVELADSSAQHARGLMQRQSLDDDAGMLFRYQQPRPGDSGFWMYQTLIPLDIAYLNADMEIVKTFTMMPCSSQDPRRCRSYAPGKTYQYALEVNAGFFAEHDIRIGDRVVMAADLDTGQDCDDIH